MSDEPFPYSQQASDSPLAKGPSRSTLSGRAWVAITAMICGTVLLLCGGVIGLGFYAVDRLAEDIAFTDDDSYDDEATMLAIEYAIEQVPAVEHGRR